MSSLRDSVRVTKRRRRGGRFVVRAVDEIDAADLTATAERQMALGGDGDADVKELKESLVEKAILDRVRAEAPEAFQPGVSATVKIVSDYDVKI